MNSPGEEQKSIKVGNNTLLGLSNIEKEDENSGIFD